MNNKQDSLLNKMADMIKNPENYDTIQKLTMIGSIEVIKDRLAITDNPTIFDLDISQKEHNKYFKDMYANCGYDELNYEIEQTYGGSDNDRD